MAKRKPGKRQRRRRWRASNVLLFVGLASLAAIVVAVGFLALTGEGEPSRQRVREPTVVSEDREVTIAVVDSDYEPRNLVVRPGTEVTWAFEGSLPHTTTDPGGAFDSGTLRQGDVFTHTFDEAGTYFYFCELHHAMTGTLTVAP